MIADLDLLRAISEQTCVLFSWFSLNNVFGTACYSVGVMVATADCGSEFGC